MRPSLWPSAGSLPHIARAVDAIVKVAAARRNSFLCWRRNQRPARGARRRGMPANVRHAAGNGSGDDRRRRTSAAACGRRRGRFGGKWRARSCGAQDVSRGDVVVGIAASGTTPTCSARSNSQRSGRGYRRRHVESAIAGGARRHTSRSRPIPVRKRSPVRRG